MNGDLNFHIGDKVVYPNHGVGVIEQIQQPIDRRHHRKVLSPEHQGQQLEGNGSLQQRWERGDTPGGAQWRGAEDPLDFLSITEDISTADWKDRFKENSDRMRTGSLLEVAGVLKSSIALHQAKPLSFRERKMLERARYLLVSEIAMSRSCDETKIEELLALNLAKCKLRFPEASEFQA